MVPVNFDLEQCLKFSNTLCVNCLEDSFTLPLLFCRFTNALSGLAVNEIVQRTAGRLESLRSEGVHV